VPLVLTEEHTLLRDTAQSFLSERLPVSALRTRRDRGADAVADLALWQAMVDLGWAGVMVPEAQGGSGFGAMGLGQILEMQGRTLGVSPLLSTAMAGVAALRLGADAASGAEGLGAIAEGRWRIALAIDEGAHHAPVPEAVTATASEGHAEVSGTKRLVADTALATHLLVSARGPAGPGLYLVPVGSGVNLAARTTVDSFGAADVTFAGAPATCLSGGTLSGQVLIDAVLDCTRIGLAAEMLGTATAAFEMTLDYLKTRRQFGQLIGGFQALQHRAAQMFTDLELLRSAVLAALSAVDDAHTGPRLAGAASLAKALACEALHTISNETIQMHGGIGMTDAHDSGFYLKRARVQEHLYGGASFHRSRYAGLKGY